jgi:hypothetical protein
MVSDVIETTRNLLGKPSQVCLKAALICSPNRNLFNLEDSNDHPMAQWPDA